MSPLIEDLIVIVVVGGAALLVATRWVHFWRRASRGSGCGGGCGSGCGADRETSAPTVERGRRRDVVRLEPTRRRSD